MNGQVSQGKHCLDIMYAADYKPFNLKLALAHFRYQKRPAVSAILSRQS